MHRLDLGSDLLGDGRKIGSRRNAHRQKEIWVGGSCITVEIAPVGNDFTSLIVGRLGSVIRPNYLGFTKFGKLGNDFGIAPINQDDATTATTEVTNEGVLLHIGKLSGRTCNINDRWKFVIGNGSHDGEVYHRHTGSTRQIGYNGSWGHSIAKLTVRPNGEHVLVGAVVASERLGMGK